MGVLKHGLWPSNTLLGGNVTRARYGSRRAMQVTAFHPQLDMSMLDAFAAPRSMYSPLKRQQETRSYDLRGLKVAPIQSVFCSDRLT